MAEILIQYKDVEICRDENIILQAVDFRLHSGEFLYIVGKVGSGKSTLLKTFYADIPVESGQARIFDWDLRKIKSKQIPTLRRQIGIVFQDFQLMTDRSVNANLEFVLKSTGWKDKNEIRERIKEVLNQVGMSNKGYKTPYELSGGEQQCIVIARALLNSPKIILADEPTGNLDAESGNKIVQLLHNICAGGTAVIMTTHNQQLVQQFPAEILKCEERRLIPAALCL
ncbi:MAG: ATP-binding cassette domain-containing protein [Candidatus Symbiothrix sp.]|jgi:cell division transport system ATP-binding protein|nr:ATP-binding cassette domain-containing protein [Candidatus Symbiothrix sp.]